MKFAKELEQDLVPEWRAKYFDYRAGKKHMKNIDRAISRANGTPHLLGLTLGPNNPNSRFSMLHTGAPLDLYDKATKGDGHTEAPLPEKRFSRSAFRNSISQYRLATPSCISSGLESWDLPSDDKQFEDLFRTLSGTNLACLELPDAALKSDLDGLWEENKRSYSPFRLKINRQQSNQFDILTGKRDSASGRGRPTMPLKAAFASTRSLSCSPARDPITAASKKPLMQKFFSTGIPLPPRPDSVAAADFPTFQAFENVKSRETEFFKWMDKELNKVESFYKIKEDEAGRRLMTLRAQLREMKNRRIEEYAEARRAREIRRDDDSVTMNATRKEASHASSEPTGLSQLHAWTHPFEKIFEHAEGLIPGFYTGSKSLENMDTAELRGRSTSSQRQTEKGRDYARRMYNEVPYRSAKRQLKLALKEFYRGLELLKAYALLNRTAFGKMNKKYDKVVNAHPTLRYMSEKVNKAWFVQSEVLDGHLHLVEDMYARYFEQGNHKVAMGKLRCSSDKPKEYTGSTFRCGLLAGLGIVLAIDGLRSAVDILENQSNVVMMLQTGFLLQVYGGYFLALYLFALFCVDCYIWVQNKINYVFIFELDSSHRLDWRELSEFPAIFMFLLGLVLWLNFSEYWSTDMFKYYPCILLLTTAITIFLPAPTLFNRSRKWFAYSHLRLLLAGLYPVEFRDFFLGDMYCSLTYFMGNIEMFFCLYSMGWENPIQCSSMYSRLLGFFTTLPAIWRVFHCLRRYHDTQAVFPHLLNCSKYTLTIISYVLLSLHRIKPEDDSLLVIFITFEAISSVYSSIWDLVMDWSLCQPNANKWFLRDMRGYKSASYYYVAMVVNVILRFSWIFYVVYAEDLQHNSLVAFLIAVAEVTRRGMWALFRVENEHCTNVFHFKAFRDIPLPYPLDPACAIIMKESQTEPEFPQPEVPVVPTTPQTPKQRVRTAAMEEGRPHSSVQKMSLTRMFAEAHSKDFQKKRRSCVEECNTTEDVIQAVSNSCGRDSSDDDDKDI